jgi:hypothetical protein
LPESRIIGIGVIVRRCGVARTILRVLIIFASLAMGWAAAKAQTADPDFVLLVDAPSGPTTITCVKGCALKWVERGINPQAQTISEFGFACHPGSGSSSPQSTTAGIQTLRCSSGKVGGWITH